MAVPSPTIPTPMPLSVEQRRRMSRALTRTFLGWFEWMVTNGRNPFADGQDDSGWIDAQTAHARKEGNPATTGTGTPGR